MGEKSALGSAAAGSTRGEDAGKGNLPKGHRSQVTEQAQGTRAFRERTVLGGSRGTRFVSLVASCTVLNGSVHLHLTFYFEIILFHGKVAK